LRVLRGRKGNVREGKGRKVREGRKEGNPSPCLGVEKPIYFLGQVANQQT
jgi:hypothetical protein